jgi:hypothetical protein
VVQVVMTAGTVALAVARGAVVHLAVAPHGTAAGSLAAILRATLRRRACEPPDVVALPGARADVAAPRAPPRRLDRRVAPLATARLAAPRRERAGDALALERRQLARLARRSRDRRRASRRRLASRSASPPSASPPSSSPPSAAAPTSGG